MNARHLAGYASIAAALGMACASAWLAFAVPSARLPPLVVSPEFDDAGPVRQGDSVTRTVRLTNCTAGEVIEIDWVRGNCSCTATNLAGTRLGPGESTELSITLGVGARRGQFSAMTGIGYRLGPAAAERVARATTSVKVISNFIVEPERLAVSPDRAGSATVLVRRDPRWSRGRVTRVYASHEHAFRVERIPMPAEPYAEQFVVTWSPPAPAIGKLQRVGLFLLTDSEVEPELFVPIDFLEAPGAH